jgi:putative flippase GtrA
VWRLLRFNVSAGLISMPGNVLLALLLVSHARLPVALANVLAVGILGGLNFVLADRWAFTR